MKIIITLLTILTMVVIQGCAFKSPADIHYSGYTSDGLRIVGVLASPLKDSLHCECLRILLDDGERSRVVTVWPLKETFIGTPLISRDGKELTIGEERFFLNSAGIVVQK